MTLSIKLDEITMRNAEAEARARGESNRMAGVADQKAGKQSGLVSDLVGLLGEIGFSRIFDLERDDTVYARSGTPDFVAGNGQLIEVKSSHHDNPHLLVPAYQIDGKWTTKEAIDVYALMRVRYDEQIVTFVGWAERKDVINDANLGYFRGSSRMSYIVPAEQMTSLDSVTEGYLCWVGKTKGHTITSP